MGHGRCQVSKATIYLAVERKGLHINLMDYYSYYVLLYQNVICHPESLLIRWAPKSDIDR